jgi:hypothetical protein
MSDAITWSEISTKQRSQADWRWRVANVVFWQVAFVSVAAYLSQTLIFDEANWYRIDLYDALTWGLVVTQVFTLAIYVSRNRVQSAESSLKIFLSMGVLSAGLTVAAISFLVVDALRNNREVKPLLGISGGYWVAVFVFLVSMFLQLRLAIICLHALRSIFGPMRSPQTTQSESTSGESADTKFGSQEHYSIADIFAFTGLVAVSISAYRLVLGMVTDYDALRFLAMFYAASITSFCVYGLIQLSCERWLKLLFILAVVLIIGYTEFCVATQIRSPLLRFGFTGMLLCNVLIALATIMQMWFIERFVRTASGPLNHRNRSLTCSG